MPQELRLMVQTGHTYTISSLEFSPDGKRILTGSLDGTTRIWDTKSGKLLVNLTGNRSQRIISARFSADGKLIVTASGDSCKIWDILTSRVVTSFKFDGGEDIREARFSADLKSIYLIAAEWIAVWDIESQKLSSIGNENYFATKFGPSELSPDEKIIIFNARKSLCTPQILNLSTGARNCLEVDPAFELIFASFSPDGKKILTGYRSGLVEIIDRKSYSAIRIVKRNARPAVLGNPDFIIKGFFSPDGKKIVLISGESAVHILDGSTGNEIIKLKECRVVPTGLPYTIKAYNVSISHNGKRIAAAVNDNMIGLWNTESGELVNTMKGHLARVNQIKFSPDDQMILSASSDYTAKVWDAGSGKLLHDLNGKAIKLKFFNLSSDNNSVIIRFNDSSLKVLDINAASFVPNAKFTSHRLGSLFDYDAKTDAMMMLEDSAVSWIDISSGKTIFRADGRIKEFQDFTGFAINKDKSKITLSYPNNTGVVLSVPSMQLLTTLKSFRKVTDPEFSPQGKKLSGIFNDSSAFVWDAENGNLLFKLTKSESEIKIVQVSPDEMKILTASWSKKGSLVEIWDAGTGKLVLSFNPGTSELVDVRITSNGKQIAVYDINMNFSIWDSETGKLLVNFPEKLMTFKYSEDCKNLYTVSENNILSLWETNSFKLLKKLKLPGNSSNITNNFKYAVCGDNPWIYIYNTITEKTEYTFALIDTANFLSQIQSGYYYSTPDASKILYYVTKDLNFITFEQMDLKYNRPDKVLEAVANKNTALITAYRNAYYKRIIREKIDTSLFQKELSIPEADFVDRDTIQYDQKNERLTLRILGHSTSILDRFNIWVNEVPVFSMKGINISRHRAKSFDTTVTIILSSGENRIETSFFNVTGIESYRQPLIVKYIPISPKHDKVYFIGIGINHFADSSNDLKYCHKDITDLCVSLKTKYNEDLIADTIFDDHVTVENIKAIKRKLFNCKEDDKVIIAYSGHGLISKAGDYFLSTYNVDFNHPERNGLLYEELENLADGIKPRKKLMLIDACHSGELDKEEMQKIVASQTSLQKSNGVKLTASKGVVLTPDNVGLTNSFKLMQELFVKVARGTGATVISAAAGTQFAIERGDLKNGVFTYSILKAMQENTTIKVSELKKLVSQHVEQLTNGLQVPTSRNSTITTDWDVW